MSNNRWKTTCISGAHSSDAHYGTPVEDTIKTTFPCTYLTPFVPSDSGNMMPGIITGVVPETDTSAYEDFLDQAVEDYWTLLDEAELDYEYMDDTVTVWEALLDITDMDDPIRDTLNIVLLAAKNYKAALVALTKDLARLIDEMEDDKNV